MIDEKTGRDAVDRVAREWIGTPYHDLGEVKGPKGGTDCGKLIKCIFVEAGIIDDFDIPSYSPQHFQHRNDEEYLGFVTRFAHEIPLSAVQPADIVLYKIGMCFAHGAVVIKPGWPNIVHAHASSRVVRRGYGTSVHLGMPILDVKYFSLW
jgi:cell wall-associated NlpC family hydrolase